MAHRIAKTNIHPSIHFKYAYPHKGRGRPGAYRSWTLTEGERKDRKYKIASVAALAEDKLLVYEGGVGPMWALPDGVLVQRAKEWQEEI